MRVSEAINSRRSMRAFKPDPVSREDLEWIVTTANRAASNGNLQPWKLYVTMGEALRVVGEVLPEQRYFCRSTHPDETGFGACTADRRSELVYRPEETAWKAASRPEWLDRPAPTVVTVEVKGTRACAATGWGWSGGPDRASDAAFLATGRRRLTPEECAILVGFPSYYPFQGTKVDKYRQIGNAVAPVMGEVVGRGISAR
mgnify:CR=1 FL=1